MSFNYFFLILIIIIISLINSKVTIPFKLQNYIPETSKDDFIINYIFKNLIVNLEVGTPPQPITLSACLGEYNTIIFGANCKSYDKGVFNESKSETYEVIGNDSATVFELYWDANKTKDIFKFNKNEIKEYQFMNALEYNKDRNCYDIFCEILMEPGFLGFLVQPHKQAQYEIDKFNFISQLKKNGLIQQYDFYFDFISENSGNIIIGALPNEIKPENYKDKILTNIKVLQTDDKYRLDWSLRFDDIYYGENKIKKELESEAVVRVEFGFIQGNYEMLKEVEKDFFEELKDKKKCFKKDTSEFGFSFNYFYCNKDVNLSNFKPWKFTINSFETNFTFTKEDLVLDLGDKYLFLMVFDTSSKLILGYPFLKKYQFIFNQDKQTFGYFHNKPEEENLFPVGYIVIISILSAILIGLGIFAFIYFLKYKQKKKMMAKELSDETETDKTNNNEGLIPNEEKDETVKANNNEGLIPNEENNQ